MVEQAYLLDDPSWVKHATKIFLECLQHPNPNVGGPIRRHTPFIGSTAYDMLLDRLAKQGQVRKEVGEGWVKYHPLHRKEGKAFDWKTVTTKRKS